MADFVRDIKSGVEIPSNELAVEGRYDDNPKAAVFKQMENGEINHMCEVQAYTCGDEQGLIFSIPQYSEIDSEYPDVRGGLDELTYRGANFAEATLVVPFGKAAYLSCEPWGGTEPKPSTRVYDLEQSKAFMQYAEDVMDTCSVLSSPDGTAFMPTDEMRSRTHDSVDISLGNIAVNQNIREASGLTVEQWSDGSFLNQCLLYADAVNKEAFAQQTLDTLELNKSEGVDDFSRMSAEMTIASARKVKEVIINENPEVAEVVGKHMDEQVVDTKFTDAVDASMHRQGFVPPVKPSWTDTLKNRLHDVAAFTANIPNHFSQFLEDNKTFGQKAGAAFGMAKTGVGMAMNGLNKAFNKMLDTIDDARDMYNRYHDIHDANEARFGRTPKSTESSFDGEPVQAEIIDVEDAPREKVVQLEAPMNMPVLPEAVYEVN